MHGLILATALLMAADTNQPATVLVVTGAAGSPEYAEPFRQWADRWVSAAAGAGDNCIYLGQDAEADVAD